MFPGEDVVDGYVYENFGTAMTQQLLSRLGYCSDKDMEALQRQGLPVPDPHTHISNSMRRPFALLANALASIRTIRQGSSGKRVEEILSSSNFTGLRLLSTGDIPQGGFSSSSAMTVAVINALDALYELGLGGDRIVQLACQAEYGTGVRAGALDQATEQFGKHGVGTLISSSPKKNYRALGTFQVPTDRIRVLFPDSVDRDRVAWKWSAGCYAATTAERVLTAAEVRKLTGKAAEIAAVLLRLPLDTDFFDEIEDELVETGELSNSTRLHVRDLLRKLPLSIRRAELRQQLTHQLDWYAGQLAAQGERHTRQQAQATLDSLFAGWRDPILRHSHAGQVNETTGVPLRALVAYLYAEVAKNSYLIHHPDEWIDYVTRSQRGDKCFEIDAAGLPPARDMLSERSWERGTSGAERMECWLKRFRATPFDFNAGIRDHDLASDDWNLLSVPGTSFFRGLALIDLTEAMLKRAFGHDAIAVRVNGAGQGDYYQVHVDTDKADLDEIKHFIRRAVYQRFGLNPKQQFVEPHPGGGAVGARLSRFADLSQLSNELSE